VTVSPPLSQRDSFVRTSPLYVPSADFLIRSTVPLFFCGVPSVDYSYLLVIRKTGMFLLIIFF